MKDSPDSVQPPGGDGSATTSRDLAEAQRLHRLAKESRLKGNHAEAAQFVGMLLGVRLWYGFYGPMLESEGAFEGKVDELCRELGEKGKKKS